MVRLFGSRTRDELRGGDIDLHLEVPPGSATLEREIAFRLALERLIGDERVDVALQERGTPPNTIDEIARRGGIVL